MNKCPHYVDCKYANQEDEVCTERAGVDALASECTLWKVIKQLSDLIPPERDEWGKELCPEGRM